MRPWLHLCGILPFIFDIQTPFSAEPRDRIARFLHTASLLCLLVLQPKSFTLPSPCCHCFSIQIHPEWASFYNWPSLICARYTFMAFVYGQHSKIPSHCRSRSIVRLKTALSPQLPCFCVQSTFTRCDPDGELMLKYGSLYAR